MNGMYSIPELKAMERATRKAIRESMKHSLDTGDAYTAKELADRTGGLCTGATIASMVRHDYQVRSQTRHIVEVRHLIEVDDNGNELRRFDQARVKDVTVYSKR